MSTIRFCAFNQLLLLIQLLIQFVITRNSGCY